MLYKLFIFEVRSGFQLMTVVSIDCISFCLVTFIGRVNANDGVLFLFPKAIIALLSLIDYTGIITFFDAKSNQVAFLFTDCTHSSFLKTHAPIPPTAHAVGFLGAGSLNHARQFNVVAYGDGDGGAGSGIRTRVTSLEGWCINPYTMPA